jgi:hypothetical protein
LQNISGLEFYLKTRKGIIALLSHTQIMEIKMRQHIFDTWNSVMDSNINPLRNIPNLQVRHLIMQILAWMWVSVCSMYLGSIMFWGINAIAHTLLLAAIVITVGTFETAKRKPKVFDRIDGYNGRQNNGEHN